MRDIKPFILNQLKDLQSKKSDNSESNHRIVAVFNLQGFLYDVRKPIGGKLGMKSLVFDFIKKILHLLLLNMPFVCLFVYPT
jgi:hypothetical protein